jgi:hypothetical protein
MACRLPFPTRCLFAAVLTAAACNADTSPIAANKRSPTQISAEITAGEVQDRLNLSPEQRQKIAELGKERDAKLADMRAQTKKDGAAYYSQYQQITGEFEKLVRAELSPQQQKQWSKLKQLNFASFSGPAWRVLEEELQDELKLADGQAAAVDELQKEFCRECERIMDATGQEEVPSGKSYWESAFMVKVREASATFDARRDTLLEKVLTRPQYDRWRQIEWQRAAGEIGPAVLLDKGAVEYLTLSDAQQREIQAIADATQRQVETERNERRFLEAMKTPSADLDKALAILTQQQRQLWADLLGKPYRDRMSRLRTQTSLPADDK